MFALQASSLPLAGSPHRLVSELFCARKSFEIFNSSSDLPSRALYLAMQTETEMASRFWQKIQIYNLECGQDHIDLSSRIWSRFWGSTIWNVIQIKDIYNLERGQDHKPCAQLLSNGVILLRCVVSFLSINCSMYQHVWSFISSKRHNFCIDMYVACIIVPGKNFRCMF